jgi:hypothetical protein
MKYPSDIVIPASAPEAGTQVRSVAGIKRVLQVKARTPEQPQQRHEAQITQEKRHAVQAERRTYCRRIEHLPVLVELRAGLVRRRRNQRASDPMEHVDLKV